MISNLKPQLMCWGLDGNEVTDHNRSPLSVSTERIGKKTRMWNGTLRNQWIADKKTFSCSWNNIPLDDDKTVDSHHGGAWIENFYKENTGEFTLRLFFADGTESQYQVMMSDFSKDIVKRGAVELWDISIQMEEV